MATPVTTKPSVLSGYDTKDYRERLTKLVEPLASGLSGYANSTPVYGPVAPAKTTKTTASAPKVTAPAPAPVYGPTKPAVSTGGSYKVSQGDTLGAIASRNGTTVAALMAANPGIKDANKIGVGQSIVLPGGGTAKTTATATSTGGAKTTPAAPAAPTTPAAPTVTQTPEQLAAQEREALSELLGKSGFTYDQYQNIVGNISAAERASIAKDLGITDLEASVFKKPKDTSEQLYTQAYKTAGLADVKLKIDALNAEIDREREDLRTATGAIDENPFLTETSRVGRGKRVLDQAEQSISNKLDQIARYESAYNTGIEEINAMIARNKADFTENQDLNTAKLNYLLKKMEVNLADAASSKTAGSLSAYLRGSAAGKTPDLVGNSETGFYKYDPDTQRFVQVIGKSDTTKLQEEKLRTDIKNANNPVESSWYKPTSEQKALVGRFVTTEEGKALIGGQPFSSADLAELNADPSLFFAVLQKANEAGIY